MENITVKDLMLALSDYATVPQTASLREAVIALEETHVKSPGRFPHRAILVVDEKGDVVGKLSQWDVIRSLEPKYKEIGEFDQLARFGFSLDFIKNMQKSYNLWHEPSRDLVDFTSSICVKDIMYTPGEDEYVSEDSTLRIAIHQLVVGRHQSLLVLRDKRVVGVLRFIDVFARVAKMIRG